MPSVKTWCRTRLDRNESFHVKVMEYLRKLNQNKAWPEGAFLPIENDALPERRLEVPGGWVEDLTIR
jgi:hypothetical protein